MKKIMTILIILFSLLFCYLIFIFTEDNSIYYASIGDNIANNPYIDTLNNRHEYNNLFINKDYRIVDLLNTIRFNQEIKLGNKNISIHQILKKANILIVSVGMNDIYYKLKDDKKEIYAYLNKMIREYDLLLNEINKYNYNNVYILGFYNTSNLNNDIYVYLNYKLNKIVKKYNYNYVDLDKILSNNSKYYENRGYFDLNNSGYKKIFDLIVEKNKYY